MPSPRLRGLLDRCLVAVYVALAALPVIAMWTGLQGRTLHGVVEPVQRLRLRPGAFVSERYQHRLAAWFEGSLGLRGTSISVDNAILYHAFGETKQGAPVRLGEDGVLFIDEDINHFNKHGPWIPAPDAIEQLADQIADLQRRLRERGRALVPVFVPAKTSIWRDKVPAAWTLDLGPLDVRPADTRIYAAVRAALERRGVLFVDIRRRFEELIASGVPREDLFGRDARHWSAYGACLANREAAARYGELTGRAAPPHECRPSRGPGAPDHVDYDLLRLLNALSVGPASRDVPLVQHPPAAPATPKPRLLLVGTSFCWNLLHDAHASGLYRELHLDYYDQTFFRWPDGAQLPLEPGSPMWREIMRSKDLVVLDLFESYLAAPGAYVELYVKAMLAELDREPLPMAADGGGAGGAGQPAGGSTTIR